MKCSKKCKVWKIFFSFAQKALSFSASKLRGVGRKQNARCACPMVICACMKPIFRYRFDTCGVVYYQSIKTHLAGISLKIVSAHFHTFDNSLFSFTPMSASSHERWVAFYLEKSLRGDGKQWHPRRQVLCLIIKIIIIIIIILLLLFIYLFIYLCNDKNHALVEFAIRPIWQRFNLIWLHRPTRACWSLKYISSIVRLL